MAPNEFLLRILVDVITRFVRPGERVLVMAPDEPEGSRGLDAGELKEAVESACRRDRSVRLRVVGPAPGGAFPIDDWASGLKSVHGPAPHSTSPETDPGRTSVHRSDSAEGVRSRRAFDTVIAFVGATPTDQIADGSWGGLLAPSGLLILITHGEGDQGGQLEQDHLLRRTARRAGLVLLDRVAVPEPESQESDRGRPRTHALLFIHLPAPSDTGDG
ncbi:hypothetical protein AB0G73_27885 [Streptomyces sp. NPDC020719]|uniref:hypothetical protein n=1 Tax=Streptomyces sp. NPDC020719 TaxID=3154896 RepID=UPI0033FD51A0